jgi:hypothetical protein
MMTMTALFFKEVASHTKQVDYQTTHFFGTLFSTAAKAAAATATRPSKWQE